MHSFVEITYIMIQMIHSAAQVLLHFSVNNKGHRRRSSFLVIIQRLKVLEYTMSFRLVFTTFSLGKRSSWADEGSKTVPPNRCRVTHGKWGNLDLNEGNIGLLNPQCNHLASEHLDSSAELWVICWALFYLFIYLFGLLEHIKNMFTSTSADSDLYLLWKSRH